MPASFLRFTYVQEQSKNLRLGFEVTPGNGAVIANVPETTDLGRVRTGGRIEIGDVDTIDRDAGSIPRVDVAAQVAGLPTVGARAVKGEGRSDGRCHRAARTASGRGSCSRRAGSGWATDG